MDIFAYALWSGLDMMAINPYRPIPTNTAVATNGLAVALPQQEPVLPPLVEVLANTFTAPYAALSSLASPLCPREDHSALPVTCRLESRQSAGRSTRQQR